MALPNVVSTVLKRAASTMETTKAVGDISSVFPSLSGKKPDPLPARYSELKRTRIYGKEAAVQESWLRLQESLRQEIEEIKQRGSDVSKSRPPLGAPVRCGGLQSGLKPVRLGRADRGVLRRPLGQSAGEHAS